VTPRVQKRAHRLGFLLQMARDREAIAFTIPDGLELSDKERADIALANALLESERERRQREWVAVEALLPLIPPGGNEGDVSYLPRAVAARAVRLVFACVWAWDAVE